MASHEYALVWFGSIYAATAIVIVLAWSAFDCYARRNEK